MKKKIKDMTISDILKYCDNTSCEDCIFSDIVDECEVEFVRLHFEDYYEQEVEVDSNEEKN